MLMDWVANRIVAGTLSQPGRHDPEFPASMYDSGHDLWGPAMPARRPSVTTEIIGASLNTHTVGIPRTSCVLVRRRCSSCLTTHFGTRTRRPWRPLSWRLRWVDGITVYPWKEEEGMLAKKKIQVLGYLLAYELSNTP